MAVSETVCGAMAGLGDAASVVVVLVTAAVMVSRTGIDVEVAKAVFPE